MKKGLLFFIFLIALTGCQWQKKHVIKNLIEQSYQQELCVSLETVLEKKRTVDTLLAAGLIVERLEKKPEGIMGYALERKYVLSDKSKNIQNSDDKICYGVIHVEEFKDIVFEGDNQAIVSFVTARTVIQDWAQKLFSQEDKELRRVTVQKLPNDIWQIKQ